MRRLITVLLCISAFAAASRAAGAPPAGAPSLEQMDALWAVRDDSGGMTAAVAVGQALLAAHPDDYEVLWRLARAYFWLASTQPSRVSHKALAVQAMQWAAKARERRPDRVEGHYYAAVATGEYATTIGVMQALMDGVAGTIQTEAQRAYAIDPDYAEGAPGVILGRYYFLLPWPKRDLDRSRQYLEEVVRRHPGKLIARLYLAETYHALGEDELARQQLQLVATTPPAPGTARDRPDPRPLAAAAMRKWFGQ